MIKDKINNIIIVAGGTGGHIFPALAVINCLKKMSLNVRIVTDARGYKIIGKTYQSIIKIPSKGFEGKNIFNKGISIFFILLGTIKALVVLKKFKIRIVLGFGSYVQVPIMIAAKLLKINIILHEANATIGKANMVFWKHAKLKASCFKLQDIYQKNTNITGMPVREEIIKLNNNIFKISKADKLNLLIYGGSLGSANLSLGICLAICSLPLSTRNKISVTHQVKPDDYKEVSKNYLNAAIEAKIKTFFDDISDHYKKANLVISRSGASAVAELGVVGLPVIYFPLPNSIGNHQYLNALKISKKKGAWLFNENEIKTKKFITFLNTLVNSPKLLIEYANNNRKIAKPNATKDLCRLIKGVINEIV